MEARNTPSDGATEVVPTTERQGVQPPGDSRSASRGGASAASPPVPSRPAGTPPSMGAVLRRHPRSSPPSAPEGRSASPSGWLGRPAAWAIAPLPPSNVGKKESPRGPGGNPSASQSDINVGNLESSRWQGLDDHGSRGGFNVDDEEYAPAPAYPRPPSGYLGFDDEDEDEDDDDPIQIPNVGNSEFMEAPPVSQYIERAVPTRLKGPQAYRPQGRSGPDREVARLLREARKQQLADRARAKGLDPNEGAREVVTGVTRSAKTQQQYVDRGNQLLARYRRERGILQDDLLSLDTVEFADWVLSLKPTLKPTTWRPYKQSAKAVLETLPEADQAIEILDADTVESGSEPERKPSGSGVRKKGGRELPRRTSARKAKSISKPDFDRIVNYLRYLSSSKYGHTLVDWLIAGLATGLRPKEWMAASLEISEDPEAPGGRYVWLYVVNSKNTNGRANGFVRTLDLSGCRNETIDAVRRMVDRGREWLVKDIYKDMQGQCAQLMYNTAERMFPGRNTTYSLYTTRHQFMANAKSYHPPEAVSAMAGHGAAQVGARLDRHVDGDRRP